MRVLDQNNNELQSEKLDLAQGRLEIETIRTVFHEAVEAVEGLWHYEVVAEYPGGGKDVEKVWDQLPVAARAAYWEEEEIQRFIPYTAEELEAREARRREEEERQARYERLMSSGVVWDELEELLDLLFSGVTE